MKGYFKTISENWIKAIDQMQTLAVLCMAEVLTRNNMSISVPHLALPDSKQVLVEIYGKLSSDSRISIYWKLWDPITESTIVWQQNEFTLDQISYVIFKLAELEEENEKELLN